MPTATVDFGFTLQQESEIKELNAMARIYEHRKSGARLLHLANDDDNKVFSIFFRTPPADNTGVAHILEHSVLCGSRKFPLKEPFVELLKGSLNTFLNAMTFSDKTAYPVASRNDQDFLNLMDVYLDAVFYPNIHQKPEIFQQEGWHYEADEAGQLHYNGVVFNEMKGAFSSPEGVLFRRIQQSLYPDTPYGHESGGDPEAIPSLSLEEFLAFHRRYYHPANSYIYLYGNGDIAKHLEFLDRDYLSNFDRIPTTSAIPSQAAFPAPREMVVSYPIAKEDTPADKSYLALSYTTGTALDRETVLGLDLLCTMLLETPASPLKKALIESRLGKDVFGVFDGDILQPFFSIILKNSNPESKEAFSALVRSTLEGLRQTGLDPKLVTASLNSLEFKLREADYGHSPKGLHYIIASMSTWLYGGDPLEPLRYEKLLAAIRARADQGYFEELIERYLLTNPHASLLSLIPQPGLGEEQTAAEEARLAAARLALSEPARQAIVAQQERLKQFQTTPDSPEQLATIPTLALSDIVRAAEILPLVVSPAPIATLRHPITTTGIVYLKMYFDASTVPQPLIPYLTLLGDLLGAISTERYSYMELSNEMHTHLGGLSFGAKGIGESRRNDLYYPKFVIAGRCLKAEAPKLIELIEEICNHSLFSDRKRLQEVIQENRSRLEMSLMQSGNHFASLRVASYLSPKGAYNELLGGISYYKFIAGLDRNFSAQAEEIIANLVTVAGLLFNRRNLLMSLTASEPELDALETSLTTLTGRFSDLPLPTHSYDFILPPGNEAFAIPGPVHYVAKGANYQAAGHQYLLQMPVLQKILGTDYLWNTIRVRGGAYGASASFHNDGTMFFSSYRDPNLLETLAAFDGCAEYARNFAVPEIEMRKYIIGTMGRIDFPLTPANKGAKAANHYISHLRQEEIQAQREAILNTTVAEINGCADLLAAGLARGRYCVIGNESNLKAQAESFSSISNLLE